MKRAVLLAILLSIIALAPARTRASDRLSMHVTPQMAFAPANLLVRAMVEADSHNRALEVVADSSDFFRSSEVQLDGEDAPHTTLVSFRDMPPGVYEIRAVVRGSRGEELAVTHAIAEILARQ